MLFTLEVCISLSLWSSFSSFSSFLKLGWRCVKTKCGVNGNWKEYVKAWRLDCVVISQAATTEEYKAPSNVNSLANCFVMIITSRLVSV